MFKQFLIAIFFSVLLPGVFVGMIHKARVFSPPEASADGHAAADVSFTVGQVAPFYTGTVGAPPSPAVFLTTRHSQFPCSEAADVPCSSAVFLDGRWTMDDGRLDTDFSSPSSNRPATTPRGSAFLDKRIEDRGERLEDIHATITTIRQSPSKPGGAVFIAPPAFAHTDEVAVIADAAATNGVATAADWHILLAIRLAENGRAGRQFGVLHPRAVDTDLRTQAGWAAATIVANRKRFADVKCQMPNVQCDVDFIYFLAGRYCPPSVDPVGHGNWIKNVTWFFNQFHHEAHEEHEEKT